jgi:hypothetical protein
MNMRKSKKKGEKELFVYKFDKVYFLKKKLEGSLVSEKGVRRKKTFVCIERARIYLFKLYDFLHKRKTFFPLI